MFIVENPGKYISGIFKEAGDLKSYIHEIPDELMKYQKISHLEIADYPLYILEKQDEFLYYSDETERKKDLEKFIAESGEKYTFITFDITKDYASPKPGRDQMGMLDHDHFERE